MTSTGVCQDAVPNVVNLTQAAATTLLTGSGFTDAVAPADPTMCLLSQVGTVVAQTPAGGAEAPYNSAVQISVCQSSTATTTTTTVRPVKSSALAR